MRRTHSLPSPGGALVENHVAPHLCCCGWRWIWSRMLIIMTADAQAWLESRAFLSCSLLAYWMSQGEPLLQTLGCKVEGRLDELQVKDPSPNRAVVMAANRLFFL